MKRACLKTAGFFLLRNPTDSVRANDPDGAHFKKLTTVSYKAVIRFLPAVEMT